MDKSKTVSEQPADQWNAAIEAAKERFRAMPHEAWQGIEVVEVLDSLTSHEPTDEQPSQPEASKEGGAGYTANMLESCANWLDGRSHTAWAKEFGYASLMQSYAKNLRELRAALASQPVAQHPAYSYASTQATNCAGCGERKHTPLRIDEMGGYICLTCIDRKLGSLLGEFGYEQPAQGELPPISDDDKQWLHYNPNTSDLVDWIQDYARKAIVLSRAQYAAPAAGMTDEQIWQFAIRNGYVDCFSDYQDDEILRKEIIKFARALLSAAPAAAPEGLKLVPIKPTSAMGHAGEDALEETDSASAIYSAMLAAAPKPVAAQVGEQWRHIKTGGIYTLLMRGWSENDQQDIVIYQGSDGRVWTRHAAEFFDGRFEKIAAHPQAAQDKGGDK